MCKLDDTCGSSHTTRKPIGTFCQKYREAQFELILMSKEESIDYGGIDFNSEWGDQFGPQYADPL